MTKRFSLAVAIMFMFPLSSTAQVSTATLQGTVKDQTGASLPGVTVTVIHTETGASRNVVTDAGGRYVAAPLPIGGYDVRAELSGFRTRCGAESRSP